MAAFHVKKIRNHQIYNFTRLILYNRLRNYSKLSKLNEPIVLDKSDKKNFVYEMVKEKKFYSLQEWDEIKSSLISEINVTETSFPAYMMNIFYADKNLIGAKSLMHFFEQKNIQPKTAVGGNFLRLCAEFPGQIDDELIWNTYLNIEAEDFKMVVPFVSEALSYTKKWKEIFNLVESFEKIGRPPTYSYNLLALTAFRNCQFDLGYSVLEKMKKENRIPSSQVLLNWFELCEQDQTDSKIDVFFKYLHNMPVLLTHELTEKIKNYFERKNGLVGKYVEVESNGYCSNCKKTFDKLTLNDREFKVLSDKIISMVKSGENKLLTCEFPKEFDSFQAFVTETGPYDVILDTTSISHSHRQSSWDRKKMAEMMCKLVDQLTQEKKHVLIFGKKQLKTWANEITTKHGCHLFLTDSLSKDDAFLLYAAFSSSKETSIVTKQLWKHYSFVFRNDEKLLKMFKKWRASKQINIEVKEEIKLLPTRNFNSSFHHTDSAMHFPYRPKSNPNTDIIRSFSRDWLCICK